MEKTGSSAGSDYGAHKFNNPIRVFLLCTGRPLSLERSVPRRQGRSIAPKDTTQEILPIFPEWPIFGSSVACRLDHDRHKPFRLRPKVARPNAAADPTLRQLVARFQSKCPRFAPSGKYSYPISGGVVAAARFPTRSSSAGGSAGKGGCFTPTATSGSRGAAAYTSATSGRAIPSK